MAMGARTRRAAENAIASCRPFKNSTRSFYGTQGSTRMLGWLDQHPDARRIKELLSRATYVVWSYGTPIGFVTEDEDGNIEKFYVEQNHSVTTSHHQGVLKMAWSEYETIGEERRRTQAQRPVPVRYPGGDRMVVDFDAQDELMAEVSGWRSPHHP